MKAKFFEFENDFEIILADGIKFNNNPNEAKNSFIKRIEAEVDGNYMENLDLVEIEIKKLKRYGTVQLQKLHTKHVDGVANSVFRDLLAKRGIELPEISTSASTPKRTKLAITESVLNQMATSRENIGKECTFSKYRTLESFTGTIKRVGINRVNNTLFYGIFIPALAKIYYKRCDKVTV